jgi:hypothetical protein
MTIYASRAVEERLGVLQEDGCDDDREQASDLVMLEQE